MCIAVYTLAKQHATLDKRWNVNCIKLDKAVN